MKKPCFVLFLAIALLLTIFAGCGQPGYLPFSAQQVSDKEGYDSRGKLRKTEVIVYIDAAKYNPLNAGDYLMAKSGLPFFDYVILGDAYIMQDSNGYYLKFSDELKALLENRWEFVVPLQKKGIQVLLSITSAADGPSLGNMDLDESTAFVNITHDTLVTYGLDGVEFNDAGAGRGSYPDETQYDPEKEYGYNPKQTNGYVQKNAGMTKDEIEADKKQWWWLTTEWLFGGARTARQKGGCTISNLCYLLDLYIKRDSQLPIMVRNINYGAHLPDMVPSSTRIADVASTMSSITAILSSRFDVFNDPVNMIGANTTGELSGTIYFMGYIEPMTNYSKRSPLSIDLDGGNGKNVFEISEQNGTLYSFFEKFEQNEYFQKIFFSNLKAVREAKTDKFFNNPYFDRNKPITEYDDSRGTNWEKFSQRYLFNNFTTRVMQEGVICTGGDHVREW